MHETSRIVIAKMIQNKPFESGKRNKDKLREQREKLNRRQFRKPTDSYF